MTTVLRPGPAAARWWRGLQPRPDGGGGDRAALARLRRCATALDAASEQATLDLCRSLGFGFGKLDRVAVAAAVLAHVREDRPGSPAARQLGGTGPDQAGAAMSWLRFRRLIQASTDDEQLAAFRRAAALAGGAINVVDLADSLLDWDDKRRRRWLYAYHDAPAEMT
jgi:CRISPR system Cascade subunit CasB